MPESTQQAELPDAILEHVGSSITKEVQYGRIGNSIFRGATHAGQPVYLKIATGDLVGDLLDEAARLNWIDGRVSTPRILATVEDQGIAYLLMTELPGSPAHLVGGGESVRALAEALRSIHQLPVEANPFVGLVERELVQAESRTQAGEIDVESFYSSVGSSPDSVLAQLKGAVPTDELVFTHGDYCLPNVIVEGGEVSGVIDWSLASVADVHRDFMSAELTIRRNLDEAAIDLFYSVYGRSNVDEDRVRYFWLLDQFEQHHRSAGGA